MKISSLSSVCLRLKTQMNILIRASCSIIKTLYQTAPLFVLFYTLISIILALLPSMIVYLSGEIINDFIRIYEGADGSGVWNCIALILFFTVINSLLSEASNVISDFIRTKNDKKVSIKILDKFSRLKMSYFENKENQNAMNVVMYSQFAVSRSFFVYMGIISNAVKFASLLVVIATYYPWLSMVYLLTTLPGIAITARYRKNFDQFSIDQIPQTRVKDYYYSILTAQEYAKDVRMYNLFDVIKNKFNAIWKEILKKREKIFAKNYRLLWITNFIGLVGYAFLYINLVRYTYGRELSIGGLTVFALAVISIAQCFSQIANSLSDYFEIFVPRALMLIDFFQWDENRAGAAQIETSGGVEVEFKNVTFRYPNTDIFILNNLSFKINSGEKAAIVGINGAGKSTIVKLLLGMYEPDEGEIVVNGINIANIDLNHYRKQFGVCFQEVIRYPLSLSENIFLSDLGRKADESAILEAIQAVDSNFLSAKQISLDSQLTRMFDDSGIELSLGEWQKIAIARAFFRDAPFFILDEPSSALDPKAEDQVFRSFSAICGGKSGILISHRLSNIMMVDRIFYIEDGNIKECGTHDELIELDGNYAKMYRLQADNYRMD